MNTLSVDAGMVRLETLDRAFRRALKRPLPQALAAARLIYRYAPRVAGTDADAQAFRAMCEDFLFHVECESERV